MLLFILSSLAIANPYYGKWNEKPKVVVCDKIFDNEVDRALEYWERLGFEYVVSINWSQCEKEKIDDGYIVIVREEKFNGNIFALTTVRFISKTDEVVAAKVRLPKASIGDGVVIIHELGHAFGWRHSDKIGHVMNTKHGKAGLNSYGVSKKDLEKYLIK